MSRAFANLDGLMRLSRTDGIDIRPALLRVITDLFVQEPTHTRDEVQQYAELSLRLLPVVDAQTRAAVIAKLADFPETPAWLLERIASLPAQQSPITVAEGSQQVGARLRGADDDIPRLGQHLAAPRKADAVPPSAARALGERFLRADPHERQLLLLQLEEGDAAPDEGLWPRDRLTTVGRLQNAAEDRDQREFARQLQHSFGLSSRIAGEIAFDDSGEPLLIVARAAGMSAEILLRVLLLLNPTVGESIERVFSLYRLYEHVHADAAARIMASWRDDARARPRARFQSLHAPEETSRRIADWSGLRSAGEARRDQPASGKPAGNLTSQGHGKT